MATKPKPLRVVGLKKVKGKDAYSFGLCCMGGLLVNGFTFFSKSGAILPPGFISKGKKVPLVKGFGIHWRRIRSMVEELLGDDDGKIDSNDPN